MHKHKVLFLGTICKQDYSIQASLMNLSDLEEPSEAPDDQGVLTYIKKLATYVYYFAATLLGFTNDAEASDLISGKYLERIYI